jgi:peptidyl-tRNA hydrolase, PTH2 family
MAEKAAPSVAAAAISSLILGLLAGYFLGQGSSIGVFGGSHSSATGPKKSWPNSYDVKVHADSSDEADDEDEQDEDDEDEGDGTELKDFKDSREEVKLVLCVRTDLGMTKGMDATIDTSVSD